MKLFTMAKQSKTVNFSEIFQSLDSEVSLALKKCNNGCSIELLETNELERLKTFTFDLILENNVEEMSEENIQKLRICCELLLFIITSNAALEFKLRFVDVLKYINNELFTDESGIINLVSKINEFWMVKMQNPDQIHGMEYLTLKHLLNLCISEKPLVSDIQRLSGIRKSITADPFDKTVPSLRPILVKLVQNSQVLTSEHGQRFIAHALLLSHKLMMEIHKTIMLDLSTCNGKKATNYGKIYIFAWQAASEDMKKVLEKSCFQNLMESMLKEQRTSIELKKSSQNILAVLEVWHSERKKNNPDFITMITNAYQPILWKYLQSGFNVHRCNATNVFFKAFPLQRSGDNVVDAEDLFNRQFNAMLASLTDDCHIVRIIGIREVCNILSLYWNSFNPTQIQSLMSVITKQNAYDASCAEVRRMVYLGFQNLVKSSLSREYVKQVLPNLGDNIHDSNQKVRIAFFQLLICIKDLKDPAFKYSDCVSMFNIQYRLAEDGIAVGQWIVKLLIRNYYHSKMSVVEWTKRFIYLIKTYKNSYRNFFFYSSRSLPFTDACTIINEILSQIGMFVLSKFGGDEEKENNSGKSKRRAKDTKTVPLSEQNGTHESSGTESESSKKCAFEDAEVVSGLFDIVTILWILHDVKLNKAENEEILLKLYDTYIKYAQPIINYYKDCNLFLGVITLSGNIPVSLLRSYNITLPGYCIKMLKSIKVDRSDEENEKVASMIIALVKWGRGFEILEQITLWLDAAFETKDMNETILPIRRVKISESIQPNSIVAINILDILMEKEYVKLSILKKNYQELFTLWKFMSRIRKLIETRIEQGEPFEEDLVCDEFLNRCFKRYIKLIPLLKEDEKNGEEKENKSENPNDTSEVFVNRQKEMESVIEWGENFLFPVLKGENLEQADVKLITTALEDILYVADNMIIVHMVNNLFHFKIAHFVLKLLSTRYGVLFVKAASRITVALNFSAKLLFKVSDDLHIFSTVIPSLLSHTLDVMTRQELTRWEVEKLDADLPTIKTIFGKILATYQDNLSSKFGLKVNVRQLKLVVSFFADCVVNLISQEIPRKDSTIPIYSTPSRLPPVASCLFSLFHNKKIWSPLFVHVLSTKLSGENLTAKDTVSCILLLKLYAASDKKLNLSTLKKALESASRNLTNLKDSAIKRMDVRVDGIFTDNETETTTKKTWPSNAATKGYSSTWTKGDVEGSAPKEVDKEHIDESEDEGKTEAVQSFLCEGTDLEMDLINCGFELIKNIENGAESQPMEVEELS